MYRSLTFALLAIGVAVSSGLLVGCSGARPDVDVPPQYAVVPSPPTLRGWTSIVYTGDEHLDSSLSYIRAMIGYRSWRTVARFFHPADYASQFDFMTTQLRNGLSDQVAAARILEETLGLSSAGGTIFPDGFDRHSQPFVGLDRIRIVSFSSVVSNGEGRWEVLGQVELDDGTYRSLSFGIVAVGDRYHIIVPQG